MLNLASLTSDLGSRACGVADSHGFFNLCITQSDVELVGISFMMILAFACLSGLLYFTHWGAILSSEDARLDLFRRSVRQTIGLQRAHWGGSF